MPFSHAPALPAELAELADRLPPNLTRQQGAQVITQHLFPVHHRTLERWPMPTRRVNGKALLSTKALLLCAWAKYSAAPVVLNHYVSIGDNESLAAN